MYIIYMHKSKFKLMLEYTIIYALRILKRLYYIYNIEHESGIYMKRNIK